MNQLTLAAAALLFFVGGSQLQTHYQDEQSLRVEVQSEFRIEVTDFSMERDGEPVEPRFGGGGGSSETRRIVMTDTVLDAEDGRPLRLRREFEQVSSDSVMMRGDEEYESERECPLNEVTLELTSEDGAVFAEVVDGDEPDDEALLEGHHLTLALDALLPPEEVEAGDEWDLDGELLKRALAMDLEPVLFPIPERTEGEGGERGGRGGRRGGMRGGRAGGAARYVTNGEWDVKATLEPGTEEYAGVECLVISLEGECVGSLPERERGAGGGRGRGERVLVAPTRALPENSYELEIEAKLYFDPAARRPLHFELEGTLSTESTREMNRGESTMVISSAQEGTLTYTVDLSGAGEEDDSQ